MHTPFEFAIEALGELTPYTKAMFGCVAVYVEDKIIFVLRDRDDHVDDNGVWLATTREHHASLRKEFPSMRSLTMVGPRPTGWQVLPASSSGFEASVLKACNLVLKKDPRIGKVPKVKIGNRSSFKKAKARSRLRY